MMFNETVLTKGKLIVCIFLRVKNEVLKEILEIRLQRTKYSKEEEETKDETDDRLILKTRSFLNEIIVFCLCNVRKSLKL